MSSKGANEAVGQRSDGAISGVERVGCAVDVVLLAGTVGHEARWAGVPRALLPLPGTTVVKALVDRLCAAFNGSYTLCANGHTSLIGRAVAGIHASGRRLNFFEDEIPRGPAGCLRACHPYLTADAVFVAGASVWFEDDPLWMVHEHRRQGNALTVFCTRGGGSADAVLMPAGLYCADPAVLTHVQTNGYQDIKEQLIPALQRAGRRVGAVTLRKPAVEVTDWSAYLRVIGRSLTDGRPGGAASRQLAPGIWCGQNVEVAPTARIVGPVYLGDGCRIRDGAVVVGPAILGTDCGVDRDAWVVRTVAGNRTHFAAGTRVTDEFVPTSIEESVLTPALDATLADRASRLCVFGLRRGGAIGSAIVNLVAAVVKRGDL